MSCLSCHSVQLRGPNAAVGLSGFCENKAILLHTHSKVWYVLIITINTPYKLINWSLHHGLLTINIRKHVLCLKISISCKII
jgi:hypothetical protein